MYITSMRYTVLACVSYCIAHACWDNSPGNEGFFLGQGPCFCLSNTFVGSTAFLSVYIGVIGHQAVVKQAE